MRHRLRTRYALPCVASLVVAAPLAAQQTRAEPEPPTSDYVFYVAAESADLLHRVRFGPDGGSVDNTIVVGEMPDEADGPHGLRLSPDGRFLYMTTGHGIPTGKLWKIEAGPDTVVGEPILLGRFPATLDLTPDGLFAFVVNFNLHGEHVPSTVSTVYTPDLVEVAQTTTCTMPHGSRIHPRGHLTYSACMMDDRLVEMDTRTFQVSRQFSVVEGHEGPYTDSGVGMEGMAGHDMDMAAPTCSPTWAQPSADGAHVYVACNGGDRILEISTEVWSLERTWETGPGPYNLAVTPDGSLLVATLKPGAAIEVVDLATGESLGTAPTSGTIGHGIVISPDSRYAFVTVENVGMQPGKVDVFDLATLTRVASIEVGQQAGGIAFWKMEAPAAP